MDTFLNISLEIPESLEFFEFEEKYMNPLELSLSSSGFGELTGGGTLISVVPDSQGHREIEWCRIEIVLFRFEQGLKLLMAELKKVGAPKRTVLQYTLDGAAYECDIYQQDVFDVAH